MGEQHPLQNWVRSNTLGEQGAWQNNNKSGKMKWFPHKMWIQLFQKPRPARPHLNSSLLWKSNTINGVNNEMINARERGRERASAQAHRHGLRLSRMTEIRVENAQTLKLSLEWGCVSFLHPNQPLFLWGNFALLLNLANSASGWSSPSQHHKIEINI